MTAVVLAGVLAAGIPTRALAVAPRTAAPAAASLPAAVATAAAAVQLLPSGCDLQMLPENGVGVARALGKTYGPTALPAGVLSGAQCGTSGTVTTFTEDYVAPSLQGLMTLRCFGGPGTYQISDAGLVVDIVVPGAVCEDEQSLQQVGPVVLKATLIRVLNMAVGIFTVT